MPQAYLGMVPWLVVKEPGGTPAAAKQQQKLQQLQQEHLRLVENPEQKRPLPTMPAMPGMQTTPQREPYDDERVRFDGRHGARRTLRVRPLSDRQEVLEGEVRG